MPFLLGGWERETPIVPAVHVLTTGQHAGCSPWEAEKPPPRWIMSRSASFCFWPFLLCCSPSPGHSRQAEQLPPYPSHSECLLCASDVLAQLCRAGVNVSPTHSSRPRSVTQTERTKACLAPGRLGAAGLAPGSPLPGRGGPRARSCPSARSS